MFVKHVLEVFAEQGMDVNCLDKTNCGKRIDVIFNGNPRFAQFHQGFKSSHIPSHDGSTSM